MKTRNQKKVKISIATIFLIVGMLGVSSKSFAQDYVKHGTTSVAGGSATLYYKVTDNGVRFKLENKTNVTLYCKIVKVTGTWSDGKTRAKNVFIKWIPAGQSRDEIYWQTDNYSTLKTWNFDRWSVSANLEDLVD